MKQCNETFLVCMIDLWEGRITRWSLKGIPLNLSQNLLFLSLKLGIFSTSKHCQPSTSHGFMSLRKEWPVLRSVDCWFNLLCIPSPFPSGPALFRPDLMQHRLSDEITWRCWDLKARNYCASYQEPQKSCIKMCLICQAGLSKYCTRSSPGKLKGQWCMLGKENLAPINLMSLVY